MKKSGFTLIELVVVIVILGILSAVAVPKFIDLSKEAVVASLNGMEGAIKSGVKLAYVKAQIENNNAENGVLEIASGISITTHYGYPRGSWKLSMRGVLGLSNIGSTAPNVICEQDWCGRGGEASFNSDTGTIDPLDGGAVLVWPRGYKWEDLCHVYYINNYRLNTPPTINISVSGC